MLKLFRTILKFLRKILKLLTSRLFIIVIALLVQAAALVVLTLYLSKYFIYGYFIFTALSIVTILIITAKHDNPIFKLAWVIPIGLLPILGWLIYFIGGRNHISKPRIARIKRMYEISSSAFEDENHIIDELKDNGEGSALIMQYVKNSTNFPTYTNTSAEYLSPGEKFFERLCEELEKAEKFIFMEYFIVQEGVMWDTVLEILTRKAKQGVEVRMIYDDVGCVQTLPYRYYKKLKAVGIDVHVFNVFTPSLDIFMNYRDHRKITVIDGKVGFTGGNNLADEYINAYEKHGYWKDSSIMIKGDAVWALSVLFIQMWRYNDAADENYDKFRADAPQEPDGYVTVYGDGPTDGYLVGETIYRRMIENAKRYVSITTPYLILDNEMITTLCTAAQSGIDVTIITPNIPDKWYVHAVTKYNYTVLVDAGVKIYEYTGSFIHAKSIVVDDEVAVVGTQNFDFRSFYFHFECGVMLYKNSEIANVRADHIDILSKSHRIAAEECHNANIFVRIIRVFLNLFAPLM